MPVEVTDVRALYRALDDLEAHQRLFWEIHQDGIDEVTGDSSRQAVYDLLNAENVYSGPLSDFGALTRIINRVSCIDRLPKEGTYEALLLLRSAWDQAPQPTPF